MSNTLIYFFLTFPSILVSIVSLTHSPLVVSLKSINSTWKRQAEQTIKSIVINLGIISSVTYIFTKIFNKHLIGIDLCRLLLTLNLVHYVFVLLKKSKRINLFILQTESILISHLILLVPIFILGQKNTYGGSAVTGNLDIASYALTSEQFLNSGFKNLELIHNVDLNQFLDINAYQTPNFLISIFAKSFHKFAAESMMSILIIVLSLLYISLKNTFEILTKASSSIGHRLCALIIITCSINTYLAANFFLAHILVYVVLTGHIYFVNRIVFHSSKHTDFLYIAFATMVGVYTYPPVMIPLSLMIAFAASVCLIISKERDLERITLLFTATLLGILLTIPYLPNAIDLMLRQGNVTAGWEIPLMSPISLIISTSYIGLESPKIFVVLTWLILMLIIFIYFKKRENVMLNQFMIWSILSINTLIGYVIFFDVSTSQYQVWKLQSFLFFVFCILLSLLTLQGAHNPNKFLFALLLILLPNPYKEWSEGISLNHNFTTRDMIQVNNKTISTNISGLNLDLNSGFETMIIASLLNDKQIYLKSNSYYARSENSSFCTIINLGNVNYSDFQVIPLNSSYGVALPKKLKACP